MTINTRYFVMTKTPAREQALLDLRNLLRQHGKIPPTPNSKLIDTGLRIAIGHLNTLLIENKKLGLTIEQPKPLGEQLTNDVKLV